MKKKAIDIIMSLTLLFLMAYQVTGEALHEWIGIAMTVLVICHHILNRNWCGALFKGKYQPGRILTTGTDFLMLVSLALTSFCGMSMSGHAVPFLYGMADISFVRHFHLAMSYWSFVLMGLHLGLHIPAMVMRIRFSDRTRMILTAVFALAAGYGWFLFLRSEIPDYMFFRNPFAFFDYEKAKAPVIFENLMMLVFWGFLGSQLADLCVSRGGKRNKLLPVAFILFAVLWGVVLVMVIHTP